MTQQLAGYIMRLFILFMHCCGNGFNPKTHSGTKAIFNKEFILTGKVESRFSDFYSFLMAKRFEADYGDFVFIDERKIENMLAETEQFKNALITSTKLKP